MRKVLEQTTEKKFQKFILEDIDALQSATSSEVFVDASEAFLKKWKKQTNFIRYFRQERLERNPKWYLGAASESPSTNNALESFNRVIKDQNTLRERHPLSRFLVIATEMINNWSNQFTEEAFATTPVPQLSDWTAGYQWAKLNKNVQIVQSAEADITYQVTTSDSREAAKEKIWKTFDDYKNVFFSSWNVTMPKEQSEWINGKCDCPQFSRKYICKHLLGIAIRLKYVEPPIEAKALQIGQKRKRGRPSKARAALVLQ